MEEEQKYLEQKGKVKAGDALILCLRISSLQAKGPPKFNTRIKCSIDCTFHQTFHDDWVQVAVR